MVARHRVDSVSVVIPVLDDATVLERCLVALSRQTLAPLEVVVVDNGSRDASAEVARSFGAVVLREPVRTIAAAASRGYDRARGGLIARLDADCVPGPRWLERAERAMRDRPDVAAVTGFARFVDAPWLVARAGATAYLLAYQACVGAALGHPPVFGSNFVMRRSAWQAVSPFVHRDDDLVHDDIDLSVHLRAEGRILLLRGLPMGISVRPFTEGGWGVRLRRGMHSITVHWPDELPWHRYARLLGSRTPIIRKVNR